MGEEQLMKNLIGICLGTALVVAVLALGGGAQAQGSSDDAMCGHDSWLSGTWTVVPGNGIYYRCRVNRTKVSQVSPPGTEPGFYDGTQSVCEEDGVAGPGRGGSGNFSCGTPRWTRIDNREGPGGGGGGGSGGTGGSGGSGGSGNSSGPNYCGMGTPIGDYCCNTGGAPAICKKIIK
jgi:hypothetical protein